MSAEGKRAAREHYVEGLALEVLSAFDQIASYAERLRNDGRSPTPAALAVQNTFTGAAAVNELSRVEREKLLSLETLMREPALVRVVAADEQDKRHTYYICRETPYAPRETPWKLAGRNSSIGRLGSGTVGREIEISLPGRGTQTFLILEKAGLDPRVLADEWDSIGTDVRTGGHGTFSVESLRRFLRDERDRESEARSALDRALEHEKAESLIKEGVRRAVVAKMGLRDRPILDEFQDAIFRLPLDSRLLILGPPGTGKTTTLVRRLGYMTKPEQLEGNRDREAIARAIFPGAPDHSINWLMFTPTELLKSYLKEAFNRERIPAPDANITTWEAKRRQLARNHFRILRSADGKGPFTLKEGDPFISADTVTTQIAWFEDFDDWQQKSFWNELVSNADALTSIQDSETRQLADQLLRICRSGREGELIDSIVELANLSVEVRQRLEVLRAQTRETFDGALRMEQRKDPTFIAEFASFLDTLKQAEDDSEDLADEDDEDDEDAAISAGRIQSTQRAYVNNLRRQALALYLRDRLRPSSKAGQIAQWLGERRPETAKLAEIGRVVRLQRLLTAFADPIRRYVVRVPFRYRQFRRQAALEGRWYNDGKVPDREIGASEVDAILMASMSLPCRLLTDRRLSAALDDPRWAVVADLRRQMRNQIAVDEATDFSPLQLAVMNLLASTTRSFFACGDFNQRITNWGTKDEQAFRWAVSDLNVKKIDVAYRQSRQLNELASEIIREFGDTGAMPKLPDNIDSSGYKPVLGLGLADNDLLAEWLAKRIGEIELVSRPLPTVAVLVNRESDVAPITAALQAALEDYNLHVEPCYGGKFVGGEAAVRVFDVQHIKGLEFEAVFFAGVDELADQRPDLFAKFLYVGATRAATYLGMTCRGPVAPEKLRGLLPHFGVSWS